VRFGAHFARAIGHDDAGERLLAGFRVCGQRDQPVVLGSDFVGVAFRHERVQVFVENVVLFVSEVLEALEDGVQCLFGFERDPELGKPRPERVAAAVLAQHELVRVPAHVLGAHDLVSVAALEDPVLVDSRLVRKCIRADDRLVRLDGKACNPGDQAACRDDVRRVDARIAWKHVLAGANRHHDLLERRVARAFAQPVDRALDLARAVQHGRE
jgi:hypothetical protein